MNNKILYFTEKSVRQNANSRHNRAVDNDAKAQPSSLFHFRGVCRRADTLPNSFICNGLHMLMFRPETTHPLSITSVLFKGDRGYTLEAFHFGTSRVETFNRKTCSRGRLSDRGPFRPVLTQSARPNWEGSRQHPRHRVLPIFTCSKKAISFTLTRSTETQPLLPPFTQVSRYTVAIFRRPIDEARAFSH
jgi:hypothetical protein